MSDFPSPLKSAAAMTCQVSPGSGSVAALMRLKLSISQIIGRPLSFCQRMSALPSPLKSAASLTCQAGAAGIGQRGARGDDEPVDVPDHRQAAVVLKQDVGFAVAVEVGCGLRMPDRTGIRQRRASGDNASIHVPDRRQSAVVLE